MRALLRLGREASLWPPHGPPSPAFQGVVTTLQNEKGGEMERERARGNQKLAIGLVQAPWQLLLLVKEQMSWNEERIARASGRFRCLRGHVLARVLMRRFHGAVPHILFCSSISRVKTIVVQKVCSRCMPQAPLFTNTFGW